ncbi:MAG: ribose-phosphate pyrophosphokinase [Armatimonadota bacterium]|nr:ribose-phosphate pyrophosphokinase [Armatimonadota bacterium]
MPKNSDLRIFAGNSNPGLAESIARELGLSLGKMLVSRFSDGEVRVKIDESARGTDVFLIQSTCAPVNENLMELLVMLDAFRRASAKRITCVIPYYGYARQDKKVKPREPVSARLVADLLTVAGASRVLTVDLHADQIQGFFDIPVDHLSGCPIIAEHLKKLGLTDSGLVVVSPDVGGVARARALAEMLQSPIAIIAKRRPEPNRAEVMEIIGDVSGKIAVMIDDMIDTGGSIATGAFELKKRGAEKVYACCTHPVLSGGAIERLEAAPIEKIVVTDTIPVRTQPNSKITVLSVAPLLADAIRRIHLDESVSELFKE